MKNSAPAMPRRPERRAAPEPGGVPLGDRSMVPSAEGSPITSRRIFIGRSIAATCAALAGPTLVRAAPARVEETDETALALGYKHDTGKVDQQRYPKHTAAQRCANCSFFQGGAADEWGGCAMFGRKQIAAAGWCSAWAAKPG